MELLVYQSLFAIERRRPDGLEWSHDERLQMIREELLTPHTTKILSHSRIYTGSRRVPHASHT